MHHSRPRLWTFEIAPPRRGENRRKKCHPRAGPVWLARGDAGTERDVDLLIVMPATGSKREKAVEIGVAL
jgi:hypothetical protein